MAKDPKPLSELYEKATDSVEQTKEQVLGALQDSTIEDDHIHAEDLA